MFIIIIIIILQQSEVKRFLIVLFYCVSADELQQLMTFISFILIRESGVRKKMTGCSFLFHHAFQEKIVENKVDLS